VFVFAAHLWLGTSGCFVKQPHWERWRAKLKLVSGSKHWRGLRRPCTAGGGCRGLGVSPPEKFRVYVKNPAIWCIVATMAFMMHVNDVMLICVRHKHFINGNAVPMRSVSFSRMGTVFPRVPPRNDPCSARTAAGLWPSLVHPPGTSSWTLKLLSGAC